MATGWLRGTVKDVVSGDTLLIMGPSRGGPAPEKRLTLASLMAPRMVRFTCTYRNASVVAASVDSFVFDGSGQTRRKHDR